ncbi:hypothetical protein ACXZ7E_02555 [Paenibacillus lautus]
MNSIPEYGKFLDYAGTKIVNISKSLKNVAETKPENLEELKDTRNKVQSEFIKFTEVRNMAASYPAPGIIENEHRELVDSLDDYLGGIKLQLNSIDIVNGSYDSDSFHQGLAKQVIGEARIEDVLKRILAKCTK